MRRELLLIGEMIEAASQAQFAGRWHRPRHPQRGPSAPRRLALELHRPRRGGNSARRPGEGAVPGSRGRNPLASATGSSTAIGRSICRSCTPQRRISCRSASADWLAPNRSTAEIGRVDTPSRHRPCSRARRSGDPGDCGRRRQGARTASRATAPRRRSAPGSTCTAGWAGLAPGRHPDGGTSRSARTSA